MIIHTRAYPRAGLVGNPSDGYFGKTIAFTFRNFSANVTLYQSPELEILPSIRDHSVFGGILELVEDVNLYGYYGGIRLLKAAIKRFVDHCDENRIELDKRNFTIRYESNIPHLVGLAGSSAIITACFRALLAFYQVTIPNPILANLILSVERDELRISAGLQDRVAQVYEGVTYMDFERRHMEKHGHGRYVPMDPKQLPPLYIAYRADLSEGSEIMHSDLRSRFERGDKDVLNAIRTWAALTETVHEALQEGDRQGVAEALDRNFDQRRAVCAISEANLQMVESARACGASAKFTGSGGAIVGTYPDERAFTRLKKRLGQQKVKVIKPRIATRRRSPSH